MEDMNLTIHELHEKLISGEASSLELTRGLIGKIRRLDPELNGFYNCDGRRSVMLGRGCRQKDQGWR